MILYKLISFLTLLSGKRSAKEEQDEGQDLSAWLLFSFVNWCLVDGTFYFEERAASKWELVRCSCEKKIELKISTSKHQRACFRDWHLTAHLSTYFFVESCRLQNGFEMSQRSFTCNLCFTEGGFLTDTSFKVPSFANELTRSFFCSNTLFVPLICIFLFHYSTPVDRWQLVRLRN